MADDVVRRIGQDLVLGALESEDANAYLLGLTDGLAAAREMIAHRLARGEAAGVAPRSDEQEPLRRLRQLDELLTDTPLPRRRPRTRRRRDDVGLESQSNWLAALAIGLVYDHVPTEDDVRQLAAAAEPMHAALREAAAKLAALPRIDPSSKAAAIDLLHRAELEPQG